MISSYEKKIGNREESSDMQQWVTSLTKFTNKPLPRSLATKIDEYFAYFWQSDRLSGLT